jgi:hypothetical protein
MRTMRLHRRSSNLPQQEHQRIHPIRIVREAGLLGLAEGHCAVANDALDVLGAECQYLV